MDSPKAGSTRRAAVVKWGAGILAVVIASFLGILLKDWLERHQERITSFVFDFHVSPRIMKPQGTVINAAVILPNGDTLSRFFRAEPPDLLQTSGSLLCRRGGRCQETERDHQQREAAGGDRPESRSRHSVPLSLVVVRYPRGTRLPSSTVSLGNSLWRPVRMFP